MMGHAAELHCNQILVLPLGVIVNKSLLQFDPVEFIVCVCSVVNGETQILL